MDVIEFIKVVGISGLIALIWYIYHKSTAGQFNQILNQQAQREQQNNANFEKLIEMQSNREDKNFNLLKDMVNNNILQNEKLQQIQNSINSNNWCPLWRGVIEGLEIDIKTKKKGTIINESGNNES